MQEAKDHVMQNSNHHTFHIPVLGVGYSVDTPLKVARFGISSVMSIMDDELLETLRGFHAMRANLPYEPINNKEHDYRAKRITAYLNLVGTIVDKQIAALRSAAFVPGSEIEQYFELLPEQSELKKLYGQMKAAGDTRQKHELETLLRSRLTAGSIDVNIMAKVDNLASSADGVQMPQEYSDALSALRGFAESELDSAVVLSAGYNPRLYSYLENFRCFYPDEQGQLKKKIILKVSDYRSALVQGKILAKKGLWISEVRIESGLNCGGHAFATDGLLLGPILEEFKNKRHELVAELFTLCNAAIRDKGVPQFTEAPALRVTVQGGIGTANEHEFLMTYYGVDGTGWGSPFLLVPEVTNVDEQTLQALSIAKEEDYFLSQASPLGVPFNNFRNSSAEAQRKYRIEKQRPGSPCFKKYLVSNTEFTEEAICTASRAYQHRKLKQLEQENLPAAEHAAKVSDIVAKDCLCLGLAAPALIKNGLPVPHKLAAVTICPGPNLAYFSGIFSLSQMVGHIYGRINILNSLPRPHMFVKELSLYIDYLSNKVKTAEANARQAKYLTTFRNNLLDGIDYYLRLLPSIKNEAEDYINTMREALVAGGSAIRSFAIGERNSLQGQKTTLV